MKKSLCILALACGFASAAPLAWAAAPGEAGPLAEKMFGELDGNGDGAVSRAEFDAFNAQRFKELDANHDGKISHEEMAAAHTKMIENARESFNKRFDAADASHDGALSRAEAEKMPGVSRHFDELDANKDGQLTRAELAAAAEKMRRSRDRQKRAPGQAE